MPRFGQRSREKLATCDSRLQKLLNYVVKHYDCSVLEGFRMEAEQNKLFDEGKTKVQWPNSKHNQYPSKAVDVVYYDTENNTINWDDYKGHYHFAGFVMGVAASMRIPLKLRWGGDWDRDKDLNDQKFNDLVHFEIDE